MVDFTVAICTYNGEKRIPEVLEKLRLQVNTEDITWEILVIDNNSNDHTAQVVEKYQKNWNLPDPIKYYFEAKQGLAYARRCAVKEAQSNLIGFLDDDNLPDPNWVKQAFIFGQKHPRAGAYGGQIHGIFEVEPPPRFARIARYFALIEGNKTYCYNEKYKHTKKKLFPPGAGIVIRKQAWLESVPEHPILSQTNEDLEMLSQIWEQGWTIWFNPEMEIDHKIPKSRFEPEYLKKFFRQNGLCRYHFRMLNAPSWQKPFMVLLYMINDLRKLIYHFLTYRKVLKIDLVAAGEMELLISIFKSPFYHWKKSISNH